MRRYAIGLAVILAIPLCMGQSCSSSFLSAVVDSINNDTTDGTTDGSTDTTTDKGVPDGAYTGTETVVVLRDNLSDALPADTNTTTASQTYTFGTDGRLVRADNTAITIGDAAYTSTQYGQVAEVVTSIGLGTNVTQYTTDAAMTLQVAGLTWNFTGTGLHTFRLTGGKVLYEATVDMVSDTAGGVAYELTIEHSATLSE